MTVNPEDLVEVWHILTANGDDPIEWLMDQAMWDAVEEARATRECIDAGDPLPTEGALTLLGTPVTIERGSVPILRYRKVEDGKIYGTPVIGNMTEAPINLGAGVGTRSPR